MSRESRHTKYNEKRFSLFTFLFLRETFEHLIGAFALQGNMEKMLLTESLMQQKRFTVQRKTLKALLTGFAKKGNTEDIIRTFDRFKESKNVLLNEDVLDVIFELYVSGHNGSIDAVAGRLYKSTDFPDALNSFVERAVRREVDGAVHQLLTIFDDTDRTTLAKFYVMALREASAEKIDGAVEVLEEHGITLQTHPSVFEVGLRSNSMQLIRAVLDNMKVNSVPIERKHFWKLIKLESANGTDAVLNIVHSMKKDFNLGLDAYTIREIVLPSMNVADDPHLTFARLRTIESNTYKLVRSLIDRCLIDNNMKVAYEFANDYKTHLFDVASLRNSLIDAFVATGDGLHFAKIINILQFSLAFSRNLQRSSAEDPAAPSMGCGKLLFETINRIRTNPQTVESLLRAFVDEGLSVSSQSAHKIKIIFKKQLNEKSVELLNTLSSGKLKPVLLDANERRRGTFDLLSSDEMQKKIEIEEEKGTNSFPLKKYLLNAYLREKNVEKVDEVARTISLRGRKQREVINLHIEMSSTYQVLDYLSEVRKTDPNFVLLRYQAARLGCAMHKENREWSEIIRVFIDNKQLESVRTNLKEVNKLLGAVTDTGNAEQLHELCNVLVENNFLVEDGGTTGNFIKVHLLNDDLPEALRAFEKQFKEKHTTYGKLPLMKALINVDDVENLQKVLDIVLTKQSDANAVLSVAQSFIQEGHIRRARVIMENYLERKPDDSFSRRCEFYHKNGKYDVLEGLLEATDGLECDRSLIYYYLLLHYCSQNEIQKALDLWRKQQALDERPTEIFLQTLASHLHQHDLDVPFQVPKVTEAEKAPELTAETKRTKAAASKGPSNLSAEAALKKALQLKDADAALIQWKKLNPNGVQSAHLASALVNLLSQGNRNTEAAEIAIQVAEVGTNLSVGPLRNLIQRLAEDGELQLLDRLSSSLPRETRRTIGISHEILKVYEKCGKWDQFFARILEKCENATDENIENVEDGIRTLRLLKILQKQSIPLNECKYVFVSFRMKIIQSFSYPFPVEEFAYKASEKGVCGPLTVLWAHYFLIDAPKNSELFDRLEQEFPNKLRAAFLTSFLIENKNEEKLQQLLEFLKTKNEIHLSAANSMIILDHVEKDRVRDALAMIDNGTVTLQQLPKNILSRLKTRIIANGDRIPDSISVTKQK